MKNFNVRDLVGNALVCAIYVVLTLINPLSYGAVQFRFSEVMAVLPFFNRKYIPGVTLGVLIANLFSQLGVVDVMVGVGICIISYTISYFIKNPYANAVIYSVLCGIFVGGELYFIVNAPLLITGTSVLIGQLVVTVIGVVVFKRICQKTSFFRKIDATA
ncbi:QueT transporter family protein [Peptostreptococcus russellii]|uniref:QueT transporter family protein n=1 Tax=Peptostreptococcus russellii TaxID=215200 RepID=UPI003F58714D